MEETGGRELSASERVQLRRVLAAEDKAVAALESARDARDALLRSLRWGDRDRRPVMPETLRGATVSRTHPGGLGRTTLYRAIGRKRDRPTPQDDGRTE